MRFKEISKVISVGVEGKTFSKRRRQDVLVLIFLLGALEFKILKYPFVCCLNISLGNFPRFSVHKSLKILEKFIANLFKGVNYLRTNQTGSQVHNWFSPVVHLQFANLLEKQTSKNIYLFINPGKYYLPIWKNETTLLKLHAQLTYK